MRSKIADAGLLVAFLDAKDQHHAWADAVFREELPPFCTAEPILSEAALVLGAVDDLLRMVETGDLILSLDLAKEVSPVRALILKYKDQQMELADACCVRLAEMLSGGVVYTVDRRDFSVYRKHGRQPVPCVFPD